MTVLLLMSASPVRNSHLMKFPMVHGVSSCPIDCWKKYRQKISHTLGQKPPTMVVVDFAIRRAIFDLRPCLNYELEIERRGFSPSLRKFAPNWCERWNNCIFLQTYFNGSNQLEVSFREGCSYAKMVKVAKTLVPFTHKSRITIYSAFWSFR